MSDTVIKVENLSKYYKLGQFNNNTFFRDLQSWIAVKRGKEDPNSKIGDGTKTGDGFWALKDIDFEIKQGDRVGIIGKNGAGKSTLLKLISQITMPTSGKIYMKGRVASLLEVGTGFHPEMTGRENIYLNGAIMGMSRYEINRKINDIIDFSEIGEHIDTPVKRYSSGMYVRLGFAVAANLESDILIADEVLAVGDAEFQKKALGKMNEVNTKEGRTILFVSHNMSAVRSLCNSGILIDQGKMVCQDDIAKVIDRYFESHYALICGNVKDKIKCLPHDPSFEFIDIKIMQNGKLVNELVGNADRIDIEYKYRIKEREKGFRVYFDLWDHYGNLLVRSFNDECSDTPSEVEKGEYVSRTYIPANFLGPSKYRLVARARIYPGRSCCGEGVPFMLSVVQNGLYNRAYPQMPCESLLAPCMQWETERV